MIFLNAPLFVFILIILFYSAPFNYFFGKKNIAQILTRVKIIAKLLYEYWHILQKNHDVKNNDVSNLFQEYLSLSASNLKMYLKMLLYQIYLDSIR